MRGTKLFLRELTRHGGTKRELSTSRKSTFSLFFLLNHSFCLLGPTELYSHSSNRASTLRTSLRCKNQLKSWLTRWTSFTFFFSLFLTIWIFVNFPFWLFLTQVINPYAKEWEAEKIFPAHKVFKKFGEAGLLGIHRFRQTRDSCKFCIYISGMRSMGARAWTTNTTALFLRPLATATVQELPWQ